MRQNNPLYRFRNFSNSRGVSLYVAIVFVSALMIVSGSLMIQMISGKANEQRWVKQTQLNNLLYSAQEAARWIVETQLPVGGVAADVQPIIDRVVADQVALADSLGIATNNCADVDGDDTNGLQPCFDIKVVGRGVEADANRAQANGDGQDFASGQFNFDYKRGHWVAANGTGLFSTPLKGTGNAVSGANDGGESKCVNPDDPNDPCSWNVLKYGESVQIPLFYETKNNDGTVAVHTLDMAANRANRAFFLRLRTPCDERAASANADAFEVVNGRSPDLGLENNEAGRAQALTILGVPANIAGTEFPRNCEADDRIELFPPVGSPEYLTFASDPVIVLWSLVDDNGKTVVATEGTDELISAKRPNFGNGQLGSAQYKVNSQLSAGRLNWSLQEAGNNIFNFINLVGSADLNDGVKHILRGIGNDLSTFVENYQNKRLYLNLKVITKLRRNGAHVSYVPHLEYQLLTSNPIAEASTKIQVTVRLWGMTAQKTAYIQPKSATNTFVLGNL